MWYRNAGIRINCRNYDLLRYIELISLYGSGNACALQLHSAPSYFFLNEETAMYILSNIKTFQNVDGTD